VLEKLRSYSQTRAIVILRTSSEIESFIASQKTSNKSAAAPV
jgi:hypothetical protein